MGLFQKDAVPFLLYSMSLQVGDDSKNSVLIQKYFTPF